MADELRLCELCEREVSTTSKHHLLPKQQGGRGTPTVNLCQPCHSTLHLLFSNKELAGKFNTIPKLRESERLEKYLNWIKGKSLERIPVRSRKRR